MFQIVNTTELDASSAQLWAVLADLPEYRFWHPSIWIVGTASLDGTIGYGLKKLAELLNGSAATARLHVYVPGRSVGWRFWFLALLNIEEWYQLTEAGVRTSLEHGIRCSGPLSRFVRNGMTRRVPPFLQEADAALERHMSVVLRAHS